MSFKKQDQCLLVIQYFQTTFLGAQFVVILTLIIKKSDQAVKI